MSEPDDQAWILQRERGEDISHVPARTRAGFDRLAALIEALPDEVPDPGWKQRILVTLDEPPGARAQARESTGWRDIARASRRTTRHRAWLAAGGLAMAAAIAVVLVWCHRAGEERSSVVASVDRPGSATGAGSVASAEPPLVTVEIRRGDARRRGGDSASIGDTLILHLQVDRPSELRVYGDAGEPLARCTETLGCTVERTGEVRRFQLEVMLRASGTVRAVLFTGAPIPESFHDLNADVETAQRANVEARQVAFVHVQ